MPSDSAKKVIALSSLKAACKDCGLRELCLPFGLAGEDLKALDQLIMRRRRLTKGESLYRVDDPLRSLYAVRSGAVKSTSLMEDGRAQIIGFYLPGELLGMDAINTDKHPCTVKALEATEVCEIPFHELEDLAHKLPTLQHQLLRLMSREMGNEEQSLIMLGHMNAEERLAACLLSFSNRYQRLGRDAGRFKLSMSRQDLGDYLGLALETVSRLFSRFQEAGLIETQGRNVVLLDLARIQEMVMGGRRDRHRERVC